MNIIYFMAPSSYREFSQVSLVIQKLELVSNEFKFFLYKYRFILYTEILFFKFSISRKKSLCHQSQWSNLKYVCIDNVIISMHTENNIS